LLSVYDILLGYKLGSSINSKLSGFDHEVVLRTRKLDLRRSILRVVILIRSIPEFKSWYCSRFPCANLPIQWPCLKGICRKTPSGSSRYSLSISLLSFVAYFPHPLDSAMKTASMFFRARPTSNMLKCAQMQDVVCCCRKWSKRIHLTTRSLFSVHGNFLAHSSQDNDVCYCQLCLLYGLKPTHWYLSPPRGRAW
jgi:hypothetical protein